MEKKLVCLLLETYNDTENYPINDDLRDAIFNVVKEFCQVKGYRLLPLYDGEQIAVQVSETDIWKGFPLL